MQSLSELHHWLLEVIQLSHIVIYIYNQFKFWQFYWNEAVWMFEKAS